MWDPALQLYGIPLRLARDIYAILDAFLTWHPPEAVFRVSCPAAKLLLCFCQTYSACLPGPWAPPPPPPGH